jgi:hypothetical protein
MEALYLVCGARSPQLMRDSLDGARTIMDRIAVLLVPIAAAVGGSVWLYGWPGRNQRSTAPRLRRRVVQTTAAVTACLAVLAFFTRTYWTSWFGEAIGLSFFLGLILLTVALLYAALPPQRDL